MHLDRKANTALAETFTQFNNVRDYIRIIVSIYAAADLDRSVWMTEREQDFFVCTASHVLMGIKDPISKEAVQIYKKHFHPTTKKNNISHYINKIRNKKWIKYDVEKREVELNPILNGVSIHEDRIDFKIRLLLKENEVD